ncbi:hypothetical protein EHS25_003715 [Saitozyma podzolica]|uniref:Uncharacterized protein n=1 Tax=Saitozyma podzolica TaxID=1890683 RepID=A0A427Y363_9TREE|nr:hypothetical protein EHS25_003715 [Saitozyma podzolica]
MLARKALRLAGIAADQGIDESLASGASFWELVDRLQPSWRLALLRMMIPASSHHELALVGTFTNADEFDPGAVFEWCFTSVPGLIPSQIDCLTIRMESNDSVKEEHAAILETSTRVRLRSMIDRPVDQ